MAHDGREAVDLAEAFRPDLVLLDIGLPKLNGYDACRRIRQEPWGQGMVIVAATGWGQEEDRRRSHEAGFDHHMVKPVDMASLVKLLGSLTPAPGSEPLRNIANAARGGEIDISTAVGGDRVGLYHGARAHARGHETVAAIGDDLVAGARCAAANRSTCGCSRSSGHCPRWR